MSNRGASRFLKGLKMLSIPLNSIGFVIGISALLTGISLFVGIVPISELSSNFSTHIVVAIAAIAHSKLSGNRNAVWQFNNKD